MDFAELLSAKLCHDLAGPIGAINNGIEFLDSQTEDVYNKALHLVKFSSNQALHRLSFLRVAYGYMGDDSEMSMNALKSLINNYFSASNVSVDFPFDSKILNLGRDFCKLILNSVLIVTNSMMHNGLIKIDISAKSDIVNKISVTGEGKIVKIEQDILDILNETNKNKVTTRNVQIFYMKNISKTANYQISLKQESNQIIFDITK